jgi:sulfonate transport system ATP-binding protein
MTQFKGIKGEHLKKSFALDGGRLAVLNDVSFAAPAGKVTVIVGKSGCGKTTLLKTVGGLYAADSGALTMDEGCKTAFVFQEARLMPWLNVRKNIEFGLKHNEIHHEKTISLIETVGLTGFEKAYPHQLSGGMQQRVALARALNYAPSFLLMDEPFAALDYFTRENMQKELLRICRTEHLGALFVTHSIDEALLIGDYILILENGRIRKDYTLPENEERDLLSHETIVLKKDILAHIN